MKINRRSRRFHDPWGMVGKTGGTICGQCYLVGGRDSYVNDRLWRFDATKAEEHVQDRFVLSPKSVEKIRR